MISPRIVIPPLLLISGIVIAWTVAWELGLLFILLSAVVYFQVPILRQDSGGRDCKPSASSAKAKPKKSVKPPPSPPTP